MAKEISENTSITISIKTIVTVAVVLCSAFGFYYKLMGEIEEAKMLPRTGNGVYSVDPKTTWPPSRGEYKMKDEMSRNKILVLEDEIEELKEEIEKLENKLENK